MSIHKLLCRVIFVFKQCCKRFWSTFPAFEKNICESLTYLKAFLLPRYFRLINALFLISVTCFIVISRNQEITAVRRTVFWKIYFCKRTVLIKCSIYIASSTAKYEGRTVFFNS